MQLKDDKNIRKILIRSTNWIGDAVMTTPAVEAIRENFPDARISVLVKPWVRDVFVANPYIDEIILYDKAHRHKGLGGQVRLAKELAEFGFDLALLLQNAFEAAWLAYLAGIPRRAGYGTDLRGILLTHRVHLHPETKKVHQVHYYLRMLEGLGLKVGKRPKLFLASPLDDRAWAKNLLVNHGIKDDHALIGINPGASYGPAKRWLPEHFLELTRRLVERPHVKIIIFGTDADTEVAKMVLKVAPEQVINMAGRTTLGQAIGMLAKCRVFVTNDSGLMHVAAALNVPLVAIFGSTDPVTTGPFSDRALVVHKNLDCSPCLKTVCPLDFRCMKEITAEEVYAATVRVLEEYKN